MIIKLLKKFIIFIISSTIFIQNTKASNEIKILFKIENQIITNQDIIEESNYLISLNSQLNNLEEKELLKIAESLEKIKLMIVKILKLKILKIIIL